MAIGANENDGNGFVSGHVRVYAWCESAWVQQGADIDGEASIDISGNSLSLSADGSVLAIGATGNDGNGNSSGHVRVYSMSGVALHRCNKEQILMVKLLVIDPSIQ